MVAMAAEESDLLWQQLKTGSDPAARERLVIAYGRLVKYVAGRLALRLPPSVEMDDLIGYGVLGLMDAMEKFRPELGVKFETYAISRIRGAMLDGLRSMDWVPHTVRKRVRQLEEAYQVLESRLGRAAEDHEVAGHLGITEEELHRLLQDAAVANLASLDDLWYEGEGGTPVRQVDGIDDPEQPPPSARLEFEETKAALVAAIDALPERERLLVTLYYYEGLTAKEIAMIMRVSQSRVSQLHSRAMLRLRGRLAAIREDLA